MYTNDVSREGSDDTDRVVTTPQPTQAQEPAGEVAYLDIGAGGYLDLGTDLSNEALSRLPKGRHVLVIAGTYGIDGYTPQPNQAADIVMEDAARYRWLRSALADRTNNGKSHWFCSIAAGHPEELDAAIDAARKQGTS